MKAFMRAAALRVPPIRRLFDHAIQQERENATLIAQHLAERQRAASELAAALEERQRLLGELAAAADERDALDLQLYVLRSDHQRAAARNQELAAALDAAEAQVAAAVRATEHVQPGLTPGDLSLLYAKLAGRMTLLSSEITRLAHPSAGAGTGRALYLDLLERALTGLLVEDTSIAPWAKGYDPELRMVGRDWPGTAPTMIGLARLRNLRVLTERVIEEGIAGDLLEAGVWRGGACILMRGVLAAYGIADRTVWGADSFAGLPVADPETYPADAGDQHAKFEALRASSEEVEANFRRYGLLDQQVRFLKGWFADTLPVAPIDRLAILRLDGDMYASTIQTLDALYAKVSPGGYVIVDDYILAGCRQAVDDFRKRHGIADELVDVDGAAVYWCKS